MFIFIGGPLLFGPPNAYLWGGSGPLDPPPPPGIDAPGYNYNSYGTQRHIDREFVVVLYV